MVLETLRRDTRTLRVGVVDSRIDSVRSMELSERALRLYRDHRIGLASATGEVPCERLSACAGEAVTVGVTYEPPPQDGPRRTSHVPGRPFDLDGLVSFAETVLSGLRREFADLSFANAIAHTTTTLAMENEAGLELAHRETYTTVALTARHRDSSELFDTVLAWEAADPEADAILAVAREHLATFLRALDRVEEGPRRVVLRGFGSEFSGALATPFANDLLAHSYRSGDTRFRGGLESGRRLLDERFTLIDRRDPAGARVCPFDHEGVVRERLDLPLFDRGVLRALAADKRSAHRHGVAATGCAVGALGELPRSGIATPDLLPTVGGLPELLDGEPGILVWLSMGGEWTPAGELVLPAQVALRLDPEGRATGRLPGVTLRGRLFEIFGEGFLGVTRQTIDPWTHHTFVGVRMDVVAR